MAIIRKALNRLRNKTYRWFHAFAGGSKIYYLQDQLSELRKVNDYLMAVWLQGQPPHPNPLNSYGRKFFSQSDEDGILLEILRRIGRNAGACLEVGAGDGTENNTLILASQGWKTIWIDATVPAIDPNCNPLLLSHHQEFVDTENLCRVVRTGMGRLGATELHVVSIDVDGNDGYLATALLDDGITPEVFIIEINEVLPPPIKFAQKYDPNHVWDKSKNAGWSLQSLDDLLRSRGYVCVGCNGQTGVNAFFVRSDLQKYFGDVPESLEQLYVGRSVHPYKYRDHRTQLSPELVENLLRQVGPQPLDRGC